MRPEAFRLGAELRRDLRQPDHRLHGLDLAEKGSDALEVVTSPMLQQPRRFRRHQPLVGIRQRTPLGRIGPDPIDDRRRVVFLLRRRQAGCRVELKIALRLSAPPHLRLRHRRDEIGFAAAADDFIRRLTLFIETPMPARIIIWAVENWILEEILGHAHSRSTSGDGVLSSRRPPFWTEFPT